MTTMERRRQSTIAMFLLIQFVLTITMSDVTLGVPWSSSTSRQRRSGGLGVPSDVEYPPPSSFDHPRRSSRPARLDDIPIPEDRRGANRRGGGYGRPVFGAPNLRSTDNFRPPNADNYWDFVLGSGTFKRRVRRMTTNSASGRHLVRRRAAGNVGLSDMDLQRLASAAEEEETDRGWKKKFDPNTAQSFFPSTAGGNRDYYEFLLGEYRR